MSDRRVKIKTVYSSAIPGCVWQIYPDNTGCLMDEFTECILCIFRYSSSSSGDNTPPCVRFQIEKRRAVYQCEALELAVLMDMLEDLILNASEMSEPMPKNGVVFTDANDAL